MALCLAQMLIFEVIRLSEVEFDLELGSLVNLLFLHFLYLIFVELRVLEHVLVQLLCVV